MKLEIPLVISAESNSNTDLFPKIDKIIKNLEKMILLMKKAKVFY